VQALAKRILGTWHLCSWIRLVDGVEEPGALGADALGQMVYSPDGWIAAHLMRRSRARFATEDLAGPSDPRERAAAYDGYQGYCGRYEVNEAGAFVLHHITLSSNPNWTGTSQKRFVKFTGDRMQLTTTPSLRQGKSGIAVLVWEQAK